MADNIFVDVSKFQDDSLAFFQNLKSKGAVAAVIKVTEGSNPGSHYVNEKLANQLKNAKAAGLKIGVYHFGDFNGTADAQAEAKWFLENASKYGIDKSVPFFLDIENSKVNANPATNDANTFLTAVKAGGFNNVGVYSMRSWFTSGRLNPSQLIAKDLWVAEYGVSKPGMTGYSQWQFSNNWQGLKVDASIDYSGFVTGAPQPKPNPAPAPQPNPTPQQKHKTFVDNLGVTWYLENGSFTLNGPTKMRWGATTKSSLLAVVPGGQVIKYDAFCYSGGYVWIRQPRGHNTYGNVYGYLPTGTEVNGVRQSYYGKFS